jgi:hypothetical protein
VKTVGWFGYARTARIPTPFVAGLLDSPTRPRLRAVTNALSMARLLFLPILIAKLVFPASARPHPLVGAGDVTHTIRSTWLQPTDTLSVLSIIGGDIVLKSLAQMTGRPIAPVAFSFGWVAYSFNTLMAVVGDGRLMPEADYEGRVIDVKSGSVRDNRSWVIGRLIRDFERPLDTDVGLRVAVYEASTAGIAGVPSLDWCWVSGTVTILLQLAVSAIPFGLDGDWGVFLIIGGGTILALATGSLPQWRSEKWACRRNTSKVVCLTTGNGSRNAMVIIGKGVGLDLEDLAAAESPRARRVHDGSIHYFMGLPVAYLFTQISCLALAVLWIVFLITVTSLQENSWYLFLAGGLGMVQNVVVAGVRRSPGAHGIHLEKIEEFRRKKVMHTLMDVEDAYPKVGKSLLDEFFSEEDGLQQEETDWWDGHKESYAKERADRWPDSLASSYELISARAALAREQHRASIQKRE